METLTCQNRRRAASMWLSLSNDDIVTALVAKPGVRLTPGQPFQVQLMTEIGLPTNGAGEAVDQDHTGMSLTGIDSLIEWLSQGSCLRMLGIGSALSLARACLTERTNGGPAKAGAVPDIPKMPDLPKGLPKPGSAGGKPGLGTPAPEPAR